MSEVEYCRTSHEFFITAPVFMQIALAGCNASISPGFLGRNPTGSPVLKGQVFD